MKLGEVVESAKFVVQLGDPGCSDSYERLAPGKSDCYGCKIATRHAFTRGTCPHTQPGSIEVSVVQPQHPSGSLVSSNDLSNMTYLYAAGLTPQ